MLTTLTNCSCNKKQIKCNDINDNEDCIKKSKYLCLKCLNKEINHNKNELIEKAINWRQNKYKDTWLSQSEVNTKILNKYDIISKNKKYWENEFTFLPNSDSNSFDELINILKNSNLTIETKITENAPFQIMTSSINKKNDNKTKFKYINISGNGKTIRLIANNF